jgi:hypothetical protein
VGEELEKKIDVRRHIELTAVLTEMLEQRIRVIESRDLNEPIDLQSKKKREFSYNIR